VVDQPRQKGFCLSRAGNEIRRLIALEGPISVERFMALALGHPQHGYYMTRDPLGATGDFTTAPEISQMFGELIGLWAAQCWLDLGQPNPVRLVECGPGRGTMMTDALRAAKAAPGFLDALQIELIETSPVLKAAQMLKLAGCGTPVAWRSRMDEISEGAPRIIIGNEFLDALPIRQYMRQNNQWHERLVGLSGDSLIMGLRPRPETAIMQHGPEGAVIEVAIAAQGFIRDLALRLKADGGVALFLDYGHTQSGFGDTLQAMRSHAFVDPLASPGESDLTAHVDFEALCKTARELGLTVHGPMAQGAFLQALGLEARTEQLVSHARTQEQKDVIRSAERRLTDTSRTGMGHLFKVIAFAAPGQPVPPGFEA
jgi:NADH dehydrogenase [ubiquinone] 1 alpha subcomplex assembly factor 7